MQNELQSSGVQDSKSENIRKGSDTDGAGSLRKEALSDEDALRAFLKLPAKQSAKDSEILAPLTITGADTISCLTGKPVDGRSGLKDKNLERDYYKLAQLLDEAKNQHSVKEEHSILDSLAAGKIQDAAALQKFRQDMAKFEERTKKLPASETVDTYKQIERLFQADGPRILVSDERLRLAQEIMSHAATPTSIDQGAHNTCNITTVECVAFTVKPSEAARLITDIALTGKYQARDYGTVHLDASLIAPDAEASIYPPQAEKRTHASQIFQIAAVNLHYEGHSFQYVDAGGCYHNVPPGKLKYEQTPPPSQTATQLQTMPSFPDTGERLKDTSTVPAAFVMDKDKPVQAPELTDTDIADICNKITGKQVTYLVNEHFACGDNPASVCRFETQEQMEKYIHDAYVGGHMPIIIKVDAFEDPFLHDIGGDINIPLNEADPQGWHVVTITDYDPVKKSVSIDNQWGPDHDHLDNSISTFDLFRATRPASYEEPSNGVIDSLYYKLVDRDGTEQELQRTVDWDRKHDTIDTRKEFELLRVRHLKKEISDGQYLDQMQATFETAVKRWNEQKNSGKFNENEYKNGMLKVQEMKAALANKFQHT
jgi:hypothetical protein